MMFGLPFREVWALDFEFTAEPGALPVPVCMVARELQLRPAAAAVAGRAARSSALPRGRSGTVRRLLRLRRDRLFPGPGLAGAGPGAGPVRRVPQRDQRAHPARRAVPCSAPWPITASRRSRPTRNTTSRELVMRGGPWTDAERRRILDYCQTDVDVLEPLLERMARPHPRPAGRARPGTAARPVHDRRGPDGTDRRADRHRPARARPRRLGVDQARPGARRR